MSNTFFGQQPVIPFAVMRPVPPPNVVQPGTFAMQPNPARPVPVVPDAPAA